MLYSKRAYDLSISTYVRCVLLLVFDSEAAIKYPIYHNLVSSFVDAKKIHRIIIPKGR